QDFKKVEGERKRADQSPFRQIVEYLVIEDLKNEYPITLLCKVVGISRASYYKWRKRRESKTQREIEDEILMKEILWIF
ncbi:IS3 family transposase, partial [Staphylococcus aureus]|nr:IS3 family transposase [Staphylococcus aureus]